MSHEHFTQAVLNADGRRFGWSSGGFQMDNGGGDCTEAAIERL
jgi:hypothetical protein